ncbi:MAG: FAD-binding oxidoreductase [Alphaproteobacteria bacterium]|nr:FAD-binding oxidoreductase [Alphaproteobacteria bacterium]MBL7098582.1 FAD-binding oxidoreductase [Alphaproteobacteria bacterium]
MTPETLARLKAAAGSNGFSEDPAEIAPHLEEWRSKYKGRSSLLLKPATTAAVSAVLAVCNEANTAVVPQGGNTGLVGAQIPFDGEVVLSLARMNKVRAVDRDAHALTVEAGVILASVHKAAADTGLYFPLSLAAEGSATIGGNLSTNAGGVAVLRYGMARDLVLGLEVVLADGRVLDLLRTLRKDNTGYDLKQLFIGAEGTLGVITAATLKLFPKPAHRATAFVAIPSPEAAVKLLREMQESTGGLISAFEIMPRIGIEFVTAHIPAARDPLPNPSPWYVLIEATSAANFDLTTLFEAALGESPLVTDAVIASSDAQRETLWALRENMSEAQKREGASIKHDVSVPVGAIPAFLEKAMAAVAKVLPGARPVSFGHIGDGNIHFNFSVPKDGDPEAFLARWEEIQRVVHDTVYEFHGSISAEHGIGIQKRDQLPRYKSAAELDVMRALKRMLDPNNILNPGKMIVV